MADIRHRMVAILPKLRAFAHSLARTTDGADDLVQATCEKALRAADSWMEGTRLDSWMFRIMQNQWIDQKRRTREQVPIEDGESAIQLVGDDGARTIEARMTLTKVRTQIEELPEEQRAVLVLVCVEDLSYREAAEVLDIPLGTVMSRLARARSALMAAVEGQDDARRSGVSS
jgi:RNA polymerase sigma-70 factor (ECF subfamily)